MKRETLAVLLSIIGMMGMAVSVIPAIFAHYRISSIYLRSSQPSPQELSSLGLLAFASDIAVGVFALTAISGFLHMARIRKIKILAVLLLIGALLTVFGNPLTSLGVRTSGAKTSEVFVIDRNALFWGAFVPSHIRVVLGINSTVTWIVDESSIHPDVIVSDSGLFNSGLIRQGSSWSYTFASAGLYGYHSVIHPWMTGTVEVEAI